MDKLVLEKKIDSILRTIQRVETHTPATLDIFLKDIDAQDIIVLNLTRIIQSCVDIAMHITANADIETPQTMSESFNALHKLNLIDKPLAEKLIKSVGFRNIAIHTYGELDLELVLHQLWFDGFRAIQSVQDKARVAGNGYSLTKTLNAVLDALGCSLRASQKAVIHVVALLVKGCCTMPQRAHSLQSAPSG